MEDRSVDMPQTSVAGGLKCAENVLHQAGSACATCTLRSVPARLGNGRLCAKEIRHNLARERPKFGRDLVRKRRKKSGTV